MYFPNDTNIIIKRVHEGTAPLNLDEDKEHVKDKYAKEKASLNALIDNKNRLRKAKNDNINDDKEFLNHNSEREAEYEKDKDNTYITTRAIKKHTDDTIDNIKRNKNLSRSEKNKYIKLAKVRGKADLLKNKYNFRTRNAVFARGRLKGRLHGYIDPVGAINK